ncbi:secondary thiamine-phosphate synthase enzyme YjbQ [Candidatus Methanosphaera massiliense]|jgi:secondary thiamine-phosphate synthase enzyme|uniref:secondary thiamine-phosphate synthase enzyme YjbQ n=1 Tax=Methanosphaera TaxID=2316 RepID=UPI002380B2D4|nr:secondary thiamine-phosphate synthase enzyme YjbQ [Candidatus Methanosphaera massiliense]MDD6286396.1 secondary thiamine-phosphate synthase enzyme YjbQ [Methanobacteriaceae archaeon]MDE4078784.1 secondary thiamine-phosphate synthase enzyme YjbQ [Candidatus Methanosphaera massiliense]
MSIIHDMIHTNTNQNVEVINITSNVNDIIRKHDITNGIVNISTKHTTSSIMINEDEEGLKKDYVKFLEKIVPNDNYLHDRIDNNATSHLKAMLTTPTQTLPIIDGKISLGTWQSIFFVELDGPRSNRTINIMIIGD